MATCNYLGCDSGRHAHGLCNRHYLLARKGQLGDPSALFGVFGRTCCEDCPAEPMGGGRWCLPCFQRRTDMLRRTAAGTPNGAPDRVAVKPGRIAGFDRMRGAA